MGQHGTEMRQPRARVSQLRDELGQLRAILGQLIAKMGQLEAKNSLERAHFIPEVAQLLAEDPLGVEVP